MTSRLSTAMRARSSLARLLSLSAVLVPLAACGGAQRSSSVSPSGNSEQAVREFMKAVADSNLTRMASLWGTARGSAAATKQPADWERRIIVIQAYLRGTNHRITNAEAETPRMSRRVVNVELSREGCTKVVPFQTIRGPDGSWLINQIDLAAVGTPGKMCDPVPGDSTES